MASMSVVVMSIKLVCSVIDQDPSAWLVRISVIRMSGYMVRRGNQGEVDLWYLCRAVGGCNGRLLRIYSR